MTELMINSYFNNLASILLGLAAWALPIVFLFLRKRRSLFSCGSLACAGFSLYFQLREILNRAQGGDFAAIADTIRAINLCAAVLLAVTLVLNAITLLRKET